MTLKALSLLKSFCQMLYDGGNCPDFPIKANWKSKAHMKSVLLCLAAANKKICTEDMLKRRNFNGPIRRPMCLEKKETMDYLLIRCIWASSLWHLSVSLMGVSRVQTSSVKDVVD